MILLRISYRDFVTHFMWGLHYNFAAFNTKGVSMQQDKENLSRRDLLKVVGASGIALGGVGL